MTVHVENVRAAGHMVELARVGADEVEHDRDGALGFGRGGGIVDIGDEEVLHSVLEPGERAAARHLDVHVVVARAFRHLVDEGLDANNKRRVDGGAVEVGKRAAALLVLLGSGEQIVLARLTGERSAEVEVGLGGQGARVKLTGAALQRGLVVPNATVGDAGVTVLVGRTCRNIQVRQVFRVDRGAIEHEFRVAAIAQVVVRVPLRARAAKGTDATRIGLGSTRRRSGLGQLVCHGARHGGKGLATVFARIHLVD